MRKLYVLYIFDKRSYNIIGFGKLFAFIFYFITSMHNSCMVSAKNLTDFWK